MTQRRQTTVKQGEVDDIMSHLAQLPEREKDPGMPLALSEIFRTKEYAAEIASALKKGYSFDQLAAIFTERCGVKITARQLKYHCTRTKNLRAKGKKSPRASSPKSSVSPVNPSPMPTESDAKNSSHVAERAVPATGDFSIERHRQHIEND